MIQTRNRKRNSSTEPTFKTKQKNSSYDSISDSVPVPNKNFNLFESNDTMSCNIFPQKYYDVCLSDGYSSEEDAAPRLKKCLSAEVDIVDPTVSFVSRNPRKFMISNLT